MPERSAIWLEWRWWGGEGGHMIPAWALGKEGDWRVSHRGDDSIGYDCVDTRAWVSFPGCQYHEYCQVSVCQEGSASWPMGTQGNGSFMFGSRPDLALCVNPFGWFWIVSFCCNKIVIISIVLLWVFWDILANYWAWGSTGNPQIHYQLIRVRVFWGPPNLWLVPEVKAVGRWMVPSTWGSGLTTGNWGQKSLPWGKWACVLDDLVPEGQLGQTVDRQRSDPGGRSDPCVSFCISGWKLVGSWPMFSAWCWQKHKRVSPTTH